MDISENNLKDLNTRIINYDDIGDIREILVVYLDSKGDLFYLEQDKAIKIEQKNTRSEALKRAQKAYRDRNRQEYNESQKKLYDENKDKPEWKERFQQSCKKAGDKYRQKKKNNIIASGGEIRKPGRPRKIKPNEEQQIINTEI